MNANKLIILTIIPLLSFTLSNCCHKSNDSAPIPSTVTLERLDFANNIGQIKYDIHVTLPKYDSTLSMDIIRSTILKTFLFLSDEAKDTITFNTANINEVLNKIQEINKLSRGKDDDIYYEDWSIQANTEPRFSTYYDNNLLSTHITQCMCDGSIHCPFHTFLFTFDRSKGSLLTLSDICLGKPKYTNKLCHYLLEHICNDIEIESNPDDGLDPSNGFFISSDSLYVSNYFGPQQQIFAFSAKEITPLLPKGSPLNNFWKNSQKCSNQE